MKSQKKKLNDELNHVDGIIRLLESNKDMKSRRYKTKSYENSQTLVKRLQTEQRERELRKEIKQKEFEKMLQERAELEEKQSIELLMKKVSQIREHSIQKRDNKKQLRENEKSKLIMSYQRRYTPAKECLYRKIEEKYNSQVVIPLLEQRKVELAKKRWNTRRIPLEEIIQHSKMHSSLIQAKIEKRNKELEEKYKEEKKMKEAQKQLYSSFIQSVIKSDEENKRSEEEKTTKRKINREKMKEYSELLKELNPVKIDDANIKNLKERIEKLNHPVRKSKSPEEIRKLYNIANISGISRNHKNPSAVDKQAITISKISTNSISLQESSGKCRPDYLTELRKHRKVYPRNESYDINIEEDLKNDNLDRKEKYNRIIKKLEILDQKVETREQKSMKNGQVNINECEAVSGILLNAIKAKLNILGNL